MQPCMIFARESACTCMVSSVPIARPCALALLVRVQCRVSRPRLAMCLVVENYAASSLLVYCAVHIYIFVCARHTGQSTPGEAACAAGAGRRELSPRADSVRCTGAGPQPDHSRTTITGQSPFLVKVGHLFWLRVWVTVCSPPNPQVAHSLIWRTCRPTG